MKVGIVGSGKIGGLVGRLLARAGHAVVFSSRHPQSLAELVEQAGPNASAGTIEEAIVSAEVVLISIPYAAVQTLGRDYKTQLASKIVIETGNPYPERDGAIGTEVRASGLGTGIWSARWLPEVRLVRGFNSVWDKTLEREAHRSGPRIGIPLAADDAQAMEVAARLVLDCGFDPVIVGPLARAKDFDVGTRVYDSNLSGPDVRKVLGIHEPKWGQI